MEFDLPAVWEAVMQRSDEQPAMGEMGEGHHDLRIS